MFFIRCNLHEVVTSVNPICCKNYMDKKQPIIYLSVKEAAKYIGIPYENFRYHVHKGRIEVAARQGEKRLFDPNVLDKWELGKMLRKKQKRKGKK